MRLIFFLLLPIFCNGDSVHPLQGHMWWMQDQPEFKKKFGSENLEDGQANGPTSSNGWGFFSFKWRGLDAKVRRVCMHYYTMTSCLRYHLEQETHEKRYAHGLFTRFGSHSFILKCCYKLLFYG